MTKISRIAISLLLLFIAQSGFGFRSSSSAATRRRTSSASASTSASSSALYAAQPGGVLELDALASLVKEYMDLRKSSQTQEDRDAEAALAKVVYVTKKSRRTVEKKKDNPLAFVTPSGWFKDDFALELGRRTDKRAPKVAHPLSNAELKKYGFSVLSDSVIHYGGPYAVGDKLAIDWIAPEVAKEVWDESLRSVRTTTYAMDFTGNLALGSRLEDKLSLADGMDMVEVKEKIRKQKERQLELEAQEAVSGSQSSNKYAEPTYKVSTSVPAAPIAKIDPIALSERFTLNPVRMNECMNVGMNE
jgi:hypothetical protein